MAQIMRCRFRLHSFKFQNDNRIIRAFFPWKYRQSWIHTSYVCNVKGKEVLMPSLSPTMESGTIVKWIKRVGDPIQAGDALADIQTDKAVMTFEVDDDGILAKIIVAEGTKDVKVGTTIALTVEPEEDWTTVEAPSTVSAAAAGPPTAASDVPPEGQTNVAMPALSPTMTSGTLVKWLIKEGEDVAPGDALADIQTDKAVMTFEIDEEATLAKILVKEGSNVEVGQLIAIMVEKGSDWRSVVIPTSVPKAETFPSSSTPSAAPPGSVPAGPKPPSSGQSGILYYVERTMKSVTPKSAHPLCQSHPGLTDHWRTANYDRTAPNTKLNVKPCYLMKVDYYRGVMHYTQKLGETKSGIQGRDAWVYGLAVKRLLEEYGLSSGSVKGTGRPNRLLKSDVLAHIQANNVQKIVLGAAPPPSFKTGAGSTQAKSPVRICKTGPSTYTDLQVSNIRAVIAKRLSESKSNIPHSYATIDINIDKLSEIRNKLKAEGVSISVNDFIVKAVSHALLECPEINTLHKDGQVIRMQNVDVSVAVSTPTGLITPILFDSARKSLTEISACIRELAGKAREGTLKPNEFQGGTFTISNLGMFGIKEFSAIINPPQTAILAVGTGRPELDPSFRKTTRLSVTLSYDRRAIVEDQAADFLAVLRAMLEDPTFLAVDRAQARRHRRE